MTSTISFATTEANVELTTSDNKVDLANLATSRLLSEPTNCLLCKTVSKSLRDMAMSGGWKQGRPTSKHLRPGSLPCSIPMSPLPVHVLEWTDPAMSWLLCPLVLSSLHMPTAHLLRQLSSAYVPASLH